MKSIIAIIAVSLAPLSAQAAFAERTVEWAPFVVIDGVTEEQLLAASDDLQTNFLKKQRGFLRRELLHLNGRNWVDVLYWRSKEDAERAIEAAHSSDACSLYFSLMEPFDESSVDGGVTHYRLIRSWPDEGE